MTPLRILFTGTVGECIPPPYAGIPKRALILGSEWKKSGVKTGYTFFYHHDKEDDLGAEGDYFFEYQKKPNKIDKIFFIVKYMFRNFSLYKELFSLYHRTYKTIDRQTILYPAYGVFLDAVYTTFKPDIVVGEAALIQSFMAGHIARKRGIPFVLETYAEVHDKSMTKSLKFNDEERGDYWRYFLGIADRIIAPSDYCACGPLTYVSKDKVSMVYATTLDVPRFDKVINREEKISLRKKLQLPEDMFLVMAVGAFTNRKGHDHIIEAVASLRDTNLKVGVVLCGAGDPEWLKTLARQKGIVGQVFFFQQVPEEVLTDLYHAVDIYCDASNTPRACLGIALTDALASRLPTLAYNVAGLPESVYHGENGYLVPVNDIGALAIAIKEMSEKTVDERRVLGERGLAIAKRIFDLPIIAKQLLDIFIQVVDKRNER